MKLPQTKQHKWNYLALSFFVPLIGFLSIMLFGGYEPFGDNRSMLYSDMYHQYYPFFVSFRNMLRNGESLLYNWNIGMGLDFLGLFSYYLASPLNLLSVLLPESWTLEYFSLLSPIKLSLASLFFAIFLKKTFKQDDLSLTLFGAFYGLCAWALGYQWNVMWLDTFALLPLVALGTISLLRDKKFFLYTISLFLSVFVNYYVGFFTCIFVFLLFICYEICRFKSISRFLSDLLRIAIFSLLAIGMTVILELPTFAALQTTQSSVNKFPEGFRLNIADENTWLGLLDAMRQVAGNMGGGLTPSFKEGLPNLYCGVGTILLAFLFLTTGQVKIRDKICSVLLLLFFIFSFIIRQLDYIWHGFHFTNMIPYRFSFLFSFVLLYMAYRAYLLRRDFKLWQLIVGGVLALGVLACSESITDPVYIAYNLIFFLFYFAILLYPTLLGKLPRTAPKEVRISHKKKQRNRRDISAALLAVTMCLELIMNIVNFGVAFPYTGVSNYPKGTADTEHILDYMKETEKDSLFYRTEMTHSQTLNDGALNNYYGISTFTSSANVKVTEFMRDLGYGAKNTYNRYCFEESSPVANLFLGLKYMIERDGNVEMNSYFDVVETSGNVHLLKNNAYLPLGFLANVQLGSVDFSKNTATFDFQNELLSAASGITQDVWTAVSRDWLIISSENVVVKTKNGSGYCTYESGDKTGTITYTYNIAQEGFLCLDLNLPKKNSYNVYLNGLKLFNETYSIPQSIAVSDVHPGDVIEIKLTCKANENSNMNIKAAILDETVFREAYDVLAASVWDPDEFSNTRLSGSISCNRDGLLYTSVPQNGNWTAYVDGVETDIILVGDCMIAVPMTEGDHSFTLLYQNKAFSLGWKISLGCVLIFAVLSFGVYLPKHRKGKYERTA